MSTIHTSPLDILFAGSGEFGLPTLSALRDAGHRIVQVITQPDRPAGRGRSLAPTPIGAEALAAGFPLLRTGDLNAEPLPAADVMVVIAFGQKIAERVVNSPRLGSVNLHASLLPKYRGAAPINWAIINGEPTAGNSIIRLATKMDAGAVLGQSELPIGELETAGELHDRLAYDGAPLMLRVLREIADGRVDEQAQDASRATIAPKLTRDAARLDFARPAAELARRVRGLYPWPGCRVRLAGAGGRSIDSLRLVRARAAPNAAHERGRPGEIMTDGSIATGDGGLEIVECQPDGKRPMTLADYQRGHPWEAGMALVAE